MKKISLLIGVTFYVTFASAQEDKQRDIENPIAYIEAILGFGNGSADGLVVGYTLNYQFEGNLLTFRNSYLASKNKERNRALSNAFIFPAYVQGNSFTEYAFLYGRRFIFGGSSLSFSGGISTNTAVYRKEFEGERTRSSLNYMAFPYEISFKFFKREKSRYRIIYGLIPVGKPTGFSRSFGIKLFGSMGKESYFGLGLTFGLGWHKVY